MTQIPDFRFRPVVIVCSGPSLSDEQCEYITRRRADDACRVIVVNDNYRRVRNADILFAADPPWWRLHARQVAEYAVQMARWSCEPTCREWGCNYWPAEAGKGIADRSTSAVKRGSSSGFMAVGLAIKFGARHIILVGADCKRDGSGRAHWFGDHPRERLPAPQPFELWREEFDSLAAPAADLGINLVNCSADTALRLIRRSTLQAELGDPDDQAHHAGPDPAVDGREHQQQ